MSARVASNAETQHADRRDASLVPTITGVRLSPHRGEAKLINISTTGVLVECSTRLQPGSTVWVIFEGGFTPSTVESRVARSSVVAVNKSGGIHYHAGLAFKEPIVLEELPSTAPPKQTAETVVNETSGDRPGIAAASEPRNRW